MELVGILALVIFVMVVWFCVFPPKTKESLQDDISTQSLSNDKESAGLSQTESISGRDIRAPDMLSTAKQQESESLSGKTYYELLGIDSDATSEMIKNAWRKKDYGQRLPIECRRAYQAAYKTLSDPKERLKYDAEPRRWVCEEEPSQRLEQEKDATVSHINLEKSRQPAVLSIGTSQNSRRIRSTGTSRDFRTQSGRLGMYNGFPSRSYGARNSYSLCPACLWRQRTVGSGRARSIRGVNRWADTNCTCRR